MNAVLLRNVRVFDGVSWSISACGKLLEPQFPLYPLEARLLAHRFRERGGFEML